MPDKEIDALLAEYTKIRVDEEADRRGIPRDFARRLVNTESAYNPDVITGRRRSAAGAIGAGQLMPGTAKDLGVNPYHVEQNIEGSMEYASRQLKDFGGDQRKAAAAYNWGPARVKKYGTDRAPAETQNYMNKVAGQQGGNQIDDLYREFQQQSSSPTPPTSGPQPSNVPRLADKKPRQNPKPPAKTAAPPQPSGPLRQQRDVLGLGETAPETLVRQSAVSDPAETAAIERRKREYDQMGTLERFGQRVKGGLDIFQQGAADMASRIGDVAEGAARGDLRPLGEQGKGAVRGLLKAGARFQQAINPEGSAVNQAAQRAALDQEQGLEALRQRSAARRRAEGDLSFIGGQEENRRLAREAAADPTLAGNVIRGGTAGLLGAAPLIAAGALGAGPAALGAITAAQSDFTRPEEAFQNIAGAMAPIPISRAVTPAINQAAKALRPALQPAARAAGQIALGGGTNVAQSLATGETDPQKLTEQAIIGGALNLADARREARNAPRPALAPLTRPGQGGTAITNLSRIRPPAAVSDEPAAARYDRDVNLLRQRGALGGKPQRAEEIARLQAQPDRWQETVSQFRALSPEDQAQALASMPPDMRSAIMKPIYEDYRKLPYEKRQAILKSWPRDMAAQLQDFPVLNRQPAVPSEEPKRPSPFDWRTAQQTGLPFEQGPALRPRGPIRPTEPESTRSTAPPADALARPDIRGSAQPIEMPRESYRPPPPITRPGVDEADIPRQRPVPPSTSEPPQTPDIPYPIGESPAPRVPRGPLEPTSPLTPRSVRQSAETAQDARITTEPPKPVERPIPPPIIRSGKRAMTTRPAPAPQKVNVRKPEPPAAEPYKPRSDKAARDQSLIDSASPEKIDLYIKTLTRQMTALPDGSPEWQAKKDLLDQANARRARFREEGQVAPAYPERPAGDALGKGQLDRFPQMTEAERDAELAQQRTEAQGRRQFREERRGRIEQTLEQKRQEGRPAPQTPEPYATHQDFGPGRKAAKQTGVPKGKVRVVDEQGAEHIINKRSANQRAIISKAEQASSSTEAPGVVSKLTENIPPPQTAQPSKQNMPERDRAFQAKPAPAPPQAPAKTEASPETVAQQKKAAKSQLASITEQMRALDRGFDTDALVSLPDLRAANKASYPTKEAFDKAVLDAADRGEIVLHRHVQPGALTEAEKAAMVSEEGPARFPDYPGQTETKYYVGAAKGQKAPAPAQTAAPKAPARQQATAGDKIAVAMLKIKPASAQGAPVSIAELRKASRLKGPEFDAAILDLAQQGKVALQRTDMISNLSKTEQDALVKAPTAKGKGLHGGDYDYYIGASFREGQAPQPKKSRFSVGPTEETKGGTTLGSLLGGGQSLFGRKPQPPPQQPSGPRKPANPFVRPGQTGATTSRPAGKQQTAQEYFDQVISKELAPKRETGGNRRLTAEAHDALRDAAVRLDRGKIDDAQAQAIVRAADKLMTASQFHDQAAIRDARNELRKARNAGSAVRAAGGITKDVLSTSRSSVYGGDISIPLRQAWPLTVPIQNWGRSVSTAKNVMFKALMSEKGGEQIRQSLLKHPSFERGQRANLELSGLAEGEEIYAGIDKLKKGLSKVPLIGKPLATLYTRTEAANEAYLDWSRLEFFDREVRKLEKKNLKPSEQLRQEKAIAEAINTMTGRTDLGEGKFKAVMDGLQGSVFTAPRLQASRIQMINLGKYISLARQSPQAAALMAKQTGSAVATVVGLGFLGTLAGVGRFVTDREDPDFGKFRAGKVAHDLSGGLLPQVKLALEIGDYLRAEGKNTLAPTSRTKEEIGSERDEMLRKAGTYIRGRETPITGIGHDIFIKGKDFQGNEMSVRKVLTSRDTALRTLYRAYGPAFVGDFTEGFKEGIGTGAQTVGTFFGAGATVITPEIEKKRREAAQRANPRRRRRRQ